MPVYSYKVRDKNGKIILGELDVAGDRELRRRLDERQYFLIEYSQKRSGILGRSFSAMSFGNRVQYRDISVFCWQLYTMLNAGLTLVNSLKVLQGQIKNPEMKAVISKMTRRVEEGVCFSEALKEQPQVFSRLFVQMVNVGEVGGVLDEIMQRLAVFYENEAAIRSRLKSALTYPIILLVISLMAVLFLVLYVLPEFSVVFRDIGVKIPVQTQLLLDLSLFLKRFWITILLLIIGLGVLVNRFLATESGRFAFDRFQLAVPLWGDLLKKALATRFTQTLSILVGSGIPILTSLEVVTDTLGNLAFERVLQGAAIDVEQGKPLVLPLQQSRIFPDMVVSMIRVGEETGALDKMLDKVAQFYGREVREAIESFTKMIEPVLMIVMASVIGYIAISIFLPLAELLRTMH